MSKTKASLLVIAATAVTLVTLFLLPYAPKTAVHTAVAEKGTLLRTVLLEGVVCYSGEQPLFTLGAGRVEKVHVSCGQRVKKGQLLISMDLRTQETALAKLMQTRYRRVQAMQTTGEVLQALAQNERELLAAEAELRAAVEAGRIRAKEDGVVGGLYIADGDYVAEQTVLGSVHGDEKCITAVARAADMAQTTQGTVAAVRDGSGRSKGYAYLASSDMPAQDEATAQLVQRAVFVFRDQKALESSEIGERMTVEMVCDAASNQVLIPLGAVCAGSKVWVVKDGKAYPEKVNIQKRNNAYAAVGEELLGKRVILSPEEYALYPGCPVKEAKRP